MLHIRFEHSRAKHEHGTWQALLFWSVRQLLAGTSGVSASTISQAESPSRSRNSHVACSQRYWCVGIVVGISFSIKFE
eukprot:9422928-Alexandrium_andersonii.AAC.1